MKLFVYMILFLCLAACVNTPRRAADINWPADPEERAMAERFYAEARDDQFAGLPPGLEFSFRDIDEKLITDHFEYRLDQLRGVELINAYRMNTATNFVDDLRLKACRNASARFLLDRGFIYEFNMIITGRAQKKSARDSMDKGFCVASELPMINQDAVDARYNTVRYWPNGDRVDGRVVDQITGAFQVVVKKFDHSKLKDPTLKVTEIKADGLLLSVSMVKEQKNNIKQSKYWAQNVKGRVLAKDCKKTLQLAALTIGAVYQYRMEVLYNKEVIDRALFTVSYPDCFLYNKK
ncbi:hypothetical protein GQF03_11485 [Sneathiella chungangensis]|uniref:DUF4852 domain-containing protein n=1 Tax=Sneathiella chungangensis TaxID=1418234 RepID=A0A845MI01_9PROT|nr:hypothetical protein [Sneathiella chungangensis]MZR22956.1 hypothetical protein [Sneathiella chungangensis]